MISQSDTGDGICFKRDEDILVFQGEEAGIPQPKTFQFCPLGVQLYTRAPMTECQLLDFTLNLPSEDGEGEEDEVKCTGLVAQCCAPDNGSDLYRVWVKFLDLPAETAARIQKVSTRQRLTCPFCANF